MDLNHIQKVPLAQTIDEVLVQLDDIIDQTIAGNNFLCAFAYIYRRTTQKIKDGIEADRFEDAKRMEKLDVSFANLYIQTYHNFQKSKKVSLSWEFSFKAKNESISLVQHILLGMNAHINLDLSVAAASVAEGKDIIELKNDFMIVNSILAEMTDMMQKELGKVSKIMNLLDIFGFRKDEKVINFSIKKARDFAWLNAMELAIMNENSRAGRIEEIDIRVLELSKMIKNPPGKLLTFTLKFISLFEIKDPQKIIDKMNNA